MDKVLSFLSRFRPRSDRELMMEYLSDAKDITQLEYMMKQWDERNSPNWNRRHW